MKTIFSTKARPIGMMGFDNFSGADEMSAPHPAEYDTTQFASLLDAPYPTQADLTEAINKLNSYVTEFNRQIQHHVDNNDQPNADIVRGWLDTATKTVSALQEKLSKIPNATSGTSGAGAPSAGTTPSGGNTGKIIMIVGIALVVATGAYFAFFHKKKAVGA